jgi:DNA repair exonuclease SbcCD ATPase subunit
MFKKLIINNLKCVESLTINFEDYKDKSITVRGRNGVGKSTIKDAITFLLYGKINNTDRIDEAINNKATSAKVTAIVERKGKDVIVSRTRTNKGSILEINGKSSEQADINAFFGIYDYFVCGSILGEFMKFSDQERRDILMGLFPSEDRGVIFTKLTGEKPDVVNLEDLDGTEKRLKQEIKLKDSERSLLSSKKELLNENLFRLRDQLSTMTSNAVDCSVELNQFVEKLRVKRSQRPEPPKMEIPDTSEIDKALSDATLNIMNLSYPSDSEIKALELYLSEKKREYERSQNSSFCPTCKRAFDDKHDNKANLVELTADMKKAYMDWKDKKSVYEIAMQRYQEEKETLQKKRLDLETLKKELIMSTEMSQSEFSDKYEKAVKAWESDISVLETKVDELSSKQKDYELYKSRMDSAKTEIESITKSIIDVEAMLKNCDTSYQENLMKAFGPKGIKFQEVLSQEKAVNALMPKEIEIKFIKENKTNEGFKPVFDIFYNNVAYPWLSTGMKMKVDMHILNLFKRDLVVIDNFEAYTGKLIKEFKGKQLIKLIAQDCDIIIE